MRDCLDLRAVPLVGPDQVPMVAEPTHPVVLEATMQWMTRNWAVINLEVFPDEECPAGA